jgi:single-strand DNA-binding protein
MSAYQNTIVLKGYLGKDAEGRTNSNQTPFTVLSLATKSSHKGKSGAFVSHIDWHRVVLFGRLANSATELVRGDHVEVRGELRSYKLLSQGASARLFWEVRAYSVERLARSQPTGNVVRTEAPA